MPAGRDRRQRPASPVAIMVPFDAVSAGVSRLPGHFWQRTEAVLTRKGCCSSQVVSLAVIRGRGRSDGAAPDKAGQNA